jgi:hypothetical protein
MRPLAEISLIYQVIYVMTRTASKASYSHLGSDSLAEQSVDTYQRRLHQRPTAADMSGNQRG